MVRNTHDLVNDHFGTAEAEQIASGTPTSGYLPVAAGAGAVAVWTDVETGGGGLTDLITGNDQDFAASLGSWTNSGGTLTRDTTYYISTMTASLKHVTTATAQYVEVPISGTFTAGTDYYGLLMLSVEETSGTTDWGISMGLHGTDTATRDVLVNLGSYRPYVGNGQFVAYAVRWRPTADRTGVTLRFTRDSGGSTTYTWHIGMARAFQSPITPMIANPNGFGSIIPVTTDSGLARLNIATNAGGLTEYENGGVLMALPSNVAAFELVLEGVDTSTMYLWAMHPASDISQLGINVEVGEDFLGFFISQKDATTVQFYADWDDYNFEFEDGAANGWGSVDASGVLRRFSTMESRTGSGSATILDTTTSIAVTHGAGYTPGASDITVTPTNNPTNDPGNFWISSVGATTFTINVRSDPGASGATFAWRVDR